MQGKYRNPMEFTIIYLNKKRNNQTQKINQTKQIRKIRKIKEFKQINRIKMVNNKNKMVLKMKMIHLLMNKYSINRKTAKTKELIKYLHLHHRSRRLKKEESPLKN